MNYLLQRILKYNDFDGLEHESFGFVEVNIFDCDNQIDVIDDNFDLNIPFDSSYFYVDISLNDSFCGLNDLEVTIVR